MATYQYTPMPAVEGPQTMSIADMINTARAGQQLQQERLLNPLAYQKSQQEVEKGGIELSQQRQKDLERRNLQEFFANPDNFQTNGRIDIDKINKVVPTIAPYTGSEYINKYTTLGKAQTEAISAKQNLTQDQRAMIAQRFAILGQNGVEQLEPYLREMDLMKKENPDNPDLNRLLDSYKTIWQTEMKPGPNLPKQAIAGAQTLLTPAQQQTAFNVSPSERMKATGEVDINNQPIYDVRDASGRVIGQTTVPTSVPANQLPGAPQTPQPGGVNQMRQQLQPTSQPLSIMRIPAGESADTGKTYQAETIAIRNSVQPAKVGLQNIDTILKYLPLAETGKFSEARQAMQSVMGNIAGSKPDELAASAREIIEKTIEDLAIQKNAALGGKFASSLETAKSSLASAGKNPTAIIKSMEQLRPLLQNISNYSAGLDKAIEKSPVKQYVKPEFDKAFNEAFDPDALSFKSAFEQGKDLKKYAKDNKISLVEQERLLNKIQAYDYLTNGDLAGYKAFMASLNRRR